MKILNRIVIFILALAAFVVTYSRDIIRLIISIADNSTAYTVLSGLMGDSVDNGMEITLSVKEIAQFLQSGTFSFSGMNFDISKFPEEMLVTKEWAIASIVLLAIALLIALIIMGCALFTQAYKTVMCFSVTATACCFAAMGCFTKFAEPFLAGEIDVARFLGQSLLGDNGLIASLGSAFVSGAISVDALQLGNAAITLAIVFIFITLWTFAYYVTLTPEAKAAIKNPQPKKTEKKKEKKADTKVKVKEKKTENKQ